MSIGLNFLPPTVQGRKSMLKNENKSYLEFLDKHPVLDKINKIITLEFTRFQVPEHMTEQRKCSRKSLYFISLYLTCVICGENR